MRDGTKGGSAGPSGLVWLLGSVALVAVIALALLLLEARDHDVAPESSRTSPREALPDTADLARELEALRTELVQLRLALPAAPAGSPAALAPSPLDPAVLQPLVAALDRLSAQLGARVPEIDAPDRDGPRRDELRELLEPQGDLSDEEWDAWEEEFGRRKDRYLFLTEQRVLDSYGRPDEAHTRDNGSWTWEYHFGEEVTVTFLFAGGRVIDVWY